MKNSSSSQSHERTASQSEGDVELKLLDGSSGKPEGTASHSPGGNKGPEIIARFGVLATIALTVYSFYYLWEHHENSLEEGNSGSNEDDKTGLVGVVYHASWITAAATGLGAIPFLFVSEMSDFWVGICNAFAGGMMISASGGLLLEGIFSDANPSMIVSPTFAVLFGLWVGIGFVYLSNRFLEQYEDISVMDLSGADTRRVLLVMGVMTFHSISEGIGIGSSYAVERLGNVISASLAVHNIPEGIAISLVLIPRGVSLSKTVLWCVFSSLPQPLLAVPAYLFVHYFRPMLPFGLGFAAGAMLWVAFLELIKEALDVLSKKAAAISVLFACGTMSAVQLYLVEEANI